MVGRTMRWWGAGLTIAVSAAPVAAQTVAVTVQAGSTVARAAPASLSPLDVPGMASPLAVSTPRLAASRDITGKGSAPFPGLGAERARILLRSLTLPGWGQATMGHRTAAWIFGLAEAGIWSSFAAFKIQERMRRDSYERTALLFAGIDLGGRDEEFRRIIGSYLSSEEYNRLVVFRDAYNLYPDDPEAYRQYIAEHQLAGGNAWSWSSIEDLLRYRSQRQRQQRAADRANVVLAVAIGNRLLSAIHAARFANAPPAKARSWNLEVVPAGAEVGDFRLGVRKRF